MNRTLVTPIDSAEHRTLCGLVAALVPHLDWRHNGLGVLQAYVREGAEREQRVHVWHPSLRRPGIEHSGQLHDHRFTLESTVLVGSLVHTHYRLRPREDGPWVLHDVVPAREALESTESYDGLVTPLPGRYAAWTHDYSVSAGSRYLFPRGEFHGTEIVESTVTLVEKIDQRPDHARILAPYGAPVVHAFAEPLPPSAWRHVLDEARAALVSLWAV